MLNVVHFVFNTCTSNYQKRKGNFFHVFVMNEKYLILCKLNHVIQSRKEFIPTRSTRWVCNMDQTMPYWLIVLLDFSIPKTMGLSPVWSCSSSHLPKQSKMRFFHLSNAFIPNPILCRVTGDCLYIVTF